MSGEKVTASPSLSVLARSCDEALEKLLQDAKESDGPKCPVTVYDDLGRFRVWANNLGAFQDPKRKTSLDYRLSEGKQMRDSVREKLEIILESSTIAHRIATGALLNRERPAIQALDASAPPTTEMDVLVSSIHDFVNLLFRLSILIRQKRPRGKEIPADFPRQDPSLDIRHVRDMFKKTIESPWLAERLGRSIADSKDIILWRQEHQRHMEHSSKAMDTAIGLAEESADVSEVASSHVATTYVDVVDGSSQSCRENAEARSTRTGKTSFADAIEYDDGGELRVPDLTRLTFRGVRLRYDEEFECPFCRTIQPPVSNYSEWNKHVFADLRPYVCTFETCTANPFPSRHEWFEHEMDAHRRQWYCRECPARIFTRTALADHLTTYHALTSSQLELVLDSSRQPLRRFDASACPLCDQWAPPDDIADNVHEFRRHLGQHLQRVFLTALQQPLNGLEIDGVPSIVEDTEVPPSDDYVAQEQEVESPLNIKLNSPSRLTSSRTYFLAPNFTFRPEGPIALGNIILDPFRPHRAISKSPLHTSDGSKVHITTARDVKLSPSTGPNYSDGVWGKFLQVAGIGDGVQHPKGSTVYTVDSLESREIELTQDYLAERMSDPRVRQLMLSDNWGSRSVYIITGIKIAKDFTFSRRLSSKYNAGVNIGDTFFGEGGVHGGEVVLSGDARDVADGGVVVGSSGTRETTSEATFETQQDFIFAYRLSKIVLKKKRNKTLEVEPYNNGAIF